MNSGEAFVHAERNQAERAFAQIIGNSPVLESVLEQVKRIAPTGSTVLIQGEMGSRVKERHLLTSSCSGSTIFALRLAKPTLQVVEHALVRPPQEEKPSIEDRLTIPVTVIALSRCLQEHYDGHATSVRSRKDREGISGSQRMKIGDEG